jgi:hypothetical protein
MLPLVWTVEPTLTEVPVVVKFATKAVTFVLYGTVTAIECVASVIVPVAGGETMLKAVIALLEAGATVTVTVYA